MREISIAERYAIALLDIAVEKKAVEKFGEELARVVKLFEDSRELRTVVTHPRVDLETRKRVLGELMARTMVNPTCQNFIYLLVDRKRISALKLIMERYAELVDKHLGRVRAEVTSARPLSAPERARLTAALSKTTGKQVVLAERVDPALIGGVITRMGGKVIDGSVRARLAALRARLTAAH